MISISKKTSHPTDEVMRRASDFFGSKGLGLEGTDRNACCIIFEGGGGYVSVTVVEGEDKRDVDIEAVEWEYQAKKFLEKI